MKVRASIYLAVIIIAAALHGSVPLAAQEAWAPIHYRVIDLGTLGGSTSSGNAINNIGWVTGSSNTASGVQLATLWRNGTQVPLGTLGGPGSDVAWPVKNNFGLISGVTENGKRDPLNESFSCPAFGLTSGNSCVAFAWEGGVMKHLPGLGGNNSIGAGNNNLGQIVGWAENNVHDPTCNNTAKQFLQFEATLWQRDFAGKWQVHQLPPYAGDQDSAATAISDFGQAVGISGRCDVAIGAYSAIHAVLWKDGKPMSLGSLGGSGWNTPQAINNRGTVVGFANGPHDVIGGVLQFRWLAFVWTEQGGMVSLGTLRGSSGALDAMSQAVDVNDEGQIVGVSYADYEFRNPRGFIYQNSRMTPLNTLIGSESSNWAITSVGGINDFGEIAGQANVVSNGGVTAEAHAVLLVPANPGDPIAYGETQQVVVPDDVQRRMHQQMRVGPFLLSTLLGPKVQ